MAIVYTHLESRSGVMRVVSPVLAKVLYKRYCEEGLE